MGKVVRFGQIIPRKQRLTTAFMNVLTAIIRIQGWFRRVKKHLSAKKALCKLNFFVRRYNFTDCKEKFDTDFLTIDEKKEEKIQEKFEREERLRKLKPMKSRVLMFKNRTFRVDTQDKTVLWSTEKKLFHKGSGSNAA
mmetsp:Transcript_21984/g.29373  ORF Transcript_21984/g.29373 Transcript_21984/m.29373 type:complete len:138 (-) Transcript_21984:13-426(-)